jgi:hypothetical protein
VAERLTPTLPELRATLAGELMRFSRIWGSGALTRELVARLEQRRVGDRELLGRCIFRVRRATDALVAAFSRDSVQTEAVGLMESATNLLELTTVTLDVAMAMEAPSVTLAVRDKAYREVRELLGGRQ